MTPDAVKRALGRFSDVYMESLSHEDLVACVLDIESVLFPFDDRDDSDPRAKQDPRNVANRPSDCLIMANELWQLVPLAETSKEKRYLMRQVRLWCHAAAGKLLTLNDYAHAVFPEMFSAEGIFKLDSTFGDDEQRFETLLWKVQDYLEKHVPKPQIPSSPPRLWSKDPSTALPIDVIQTLKVARYECLNGNHGHASRLVKAVANTLNNVISIHSKKDWRLEEIRRSYAQNAA